MIVTVASGKGGTGKTSVAINMALSIGNCQVLDCDVEEPNAHLLLHPQTCRSEPVYASNIKIDKTICRQCGVCAKFCRYNALFCSFKGVLVFPELCHGCGGCITVCPEKAISEENYEVGTLNFFITNGAIYDPIVPILYKALQEVDGTGEISEVTHRIETQCLNLK